jgi:arsenate reductase-like glutaredoxin family protein
MSGSGHGRGGPLGGDIKTVKGRRALYELLVDFDRMKSKMTMTGEEIDRMMAETEVQEAMREAHEKKYREQQERNEAEEAAQAAAKIAKEEEALRQAKRKAADDAEKVAEMERTFHRMTLRSHTKATKTHTDMS